jgi:hypothetical protein
MSGEVMVSASRPRTALDDSGTILGRFSTILIVMALPGLPPPCYTTLPGHVESTKEIAATLGMAVLAHG